MSILAFTKRQWGIVVHNPNWHGCKLASETISCLLSPAGRALTIVKSRGNNIRREANSHSRQLLVRGENTQRKNTFASIHFVQMF